MAASALLKPSRGFRDRLRNEIALQKPEAVDHGRVANAQPKIVSDYFDVLNRVLEEQATTLFNCDEDAVFLNKSSKTVIVPMQSKHCHMLAQGLCCISAAGAIVSLPLMVFTKGLPFVRALKTNKFSSNVAFLDRNCQTVNLMLTMYYWMYLVASCRKEVWVWSQLKRRTRNYTLSMSKHSDCINCSALLQGRTELEGDDMVFIQNRAYSKYSGSCGGLFVPSTALVSFITQCEHVFSSNFMSMLHMSKVCDRQCDIEKC